MIYVIDEQCVTEDYVRFVLVLSSDKSLDGSWFLKPSLRGP